MNQCWVIVNYAIENKFQWHVNQSTIVINENAFNNNSSMVQICTLRFKGDQSLQAIIWTDDDMVYQYICGTRSQWVNNIAHSDVSYQIKTKQCILINFQN